MLRSCREFITDPSNMKNFKSVCRSLSLLNRSSRGFLGVPKGKVLAPSDIFKVLGSHSLLDMAPAVENKHIYSRRIHSSTPAWSDFKKGSQRKEEIKNYICFSVIGGVCLAMFIFSKTMRSHEDYVYIDPDVKSK